MFEWLNPDFELRQRALICRNNKTYKAMILLIRQGAELTPQIIQLKLAIRRTNIRHAAYSPEKYMLKKS